MRGKYHQNCLCNLEEKLKKTKHADLLLSEAGPL